MWPFAHLPPSSTLQAGMRESGPADWIWKATPGDWQQGRLCQKLERERVGQRVLGRGGAGEECQAEPLGWNLRSSDAP